MRLLVAILTSRDAKKLQRCIESVLPQTQDVVVVCNTLDSSYENIATLVAESYGIQCIITESNGTPARGKNSVLDYFLTTNYDYLTQVDADDYLQVDAIDTLYSVIEANPEIDVLGLNNMNILLNGNKYTEKTLFSNRVASSFANITDEEHSKNLFKINVFMRKKLNCNRMILYSRKCAKYFKFDETLLGSEDLVASYKLYYDPKICYLRIDDNIYIYELEQTGNLHAFLSNPNEVMRVCLELENIIHANEIQN